LSARTAAATSSVEVRVPTKDLGWLDDFVALVHTHPYRDDKLTGPRYGSFSAADLSYTPDEPQNLNILRSGPFTFLVARTRQFMQLVKKHEADDTTWELGKAMYDLHEQTYKTTPGELAERVEAAVRTVCQTYHLLYYEGQGAELHRVTKRPDDAKP
jgi:hypothetical protein